jgi:LacI family transcriptional regulator
MSGTKQGRVWRRPTMHDVARAAGVSTKTVSRVVNGEVYVAPETAARVKDVIAELGFLRNDMAHLLRKQLSTSTIGLVIEDLGNPFYATIARAAEEVARAHECILIAGSSEEDPVREREMVSSLLQRRVDGLLIVPTKSDHGFLTPELRMGTPVVFVDRPASGIEADEVLLDNYQGARLAVDHLLARGHRRIGLISGDVTVWTGAERLRGYKAALAAAGLEPEAMLIGVGCSGVEDAELAASRLLSSPAPPTALFACNNRLSIGTVKAVARAHQRVQVVGFDDFELAAVLVPPITVVSYEVAAMGRAAAEMLFQRMAGDTSPTRRVVIPVELAERS